MKKFQHLPDGMLIIEYRKNGSQEAATILYTRYKPLIHGLIKKLSLEHEEFQDLAQEVEIKIFDNLRHSYRELGCFKKWVIRITLNAINDYLRKKSHAPINAKLDLNDFPSDLFSTNHSLYIEKIYEQLEQIVNMQSEETKALLDMVYKEDKSFSQIAKELGISKSGSHKRLKIILPKIKKLLNQKGIDGIPDDDSFIY